MCSINQSQLVNQGNAQSGGTRMHGSWRICCTCAGSGVIHSMNGAGTCHHCVGSKRCGC